MKPLIYPACLILAATGISCAHHRPATFQDVPPAGKTTTYTLSTNLPPPIVTPDSSPLGKVIAYNAIGRFVVLSFPAGQTPAMGQTFFLYRNGLKVGEVKITGPQRDENIVADVTTGDAAASDEVRDK